jgi:hypothetical protein
MTMLRRFGGAACLALATVLLGAAGHPSPKVVLVKHADYIRQALAGAKQYFVRTVDIGKDDLAAIRQRADYTPDDPNIQFYLGQGDGSAPVGVVLFQQVDTPHGPLEVGLAFGSDGVISRAAVTTCTVETKPWVMEAIGTGLMGQFAGMKQGDDPRKALGEVRGKLGGMPAYMAELVATAVGRGLVMYSTLYKGGAS